ncbi:alcohol dehydrogenase, putative [Paecilomyces variotii No. 5]|uniref:Alcohol dehydrogenase, putative n=1 Tax=Byssochlamys spectabilis (strain No. 5 / NBRC 109023) TaxID=1356009 RepID=V5GGD0_BYSSN|nr:alcohol dehydrogenase, putative [Paecilomyces variotii No. 5]
MAKSVEFNIFRGSASGEIIPDTSRCALGPFDVFVEVTHAGLCGTDRHFRNKDIALGHEGAGVVRQVGSSVTSVQTGDKVGFGWVRKICGHCDYCVSGRDQYCDEREQYGTHSSEIGSFASHAVWHESMLIKLPDGLEPDYAAPLMCGGATVWGALTSYNLKPGDRVAIHGIGGLGHMAIQFASALGCDVVVLSSTASKKDEAMQLGAKEFHVTKGDIPEYPIKKVNHLFWCGSANPDYSKSVTVFERQFQVSPSANHSMCRIVALVANDGSIYPLTISYEPPSIPILPIVANGIKIQGSAVASRLAIRKLLRFVVLHGMRPIIMKFPLNKGGIEAAFKTLEEGRMRYRGVLVSQQNLTGKPIVEKR